MIRDAEVIYTDDKGNLWRKPLSACDFHTGECVDTDDIHEFLILVVGRHLHQEADD